MVFCLSSLGSLGVVVTFRVVDVQQSYQGDILG